MALYDNQSHMFSERAKKCKKDGDRYYAKAMEAKSKGERDKFNQYMAQAMNQYNIQKDNEEKAELHKGKTWK